MGAFFITNFGDSEIFVRYPCRKTLGHSGLFQPSKNWPKNQPKILSQMSHFSAKFCRWLEQPQNITWKKYWYWQWLGTKILQTSKHKHHANLPFLDGWNGPQHKIGNLAFGWKFIKKICNSINWDSTLLIIPESGIPGKISKNWFPRILENSQFFLSLPTHSRISPRIPDCACHSSWMYVCQCNNTTTMSCATSVLHFTMVLYNGKIVQDYIS